MISLIEENRERIEAACERYRVDRLSLFGSAATGEFKPGESDLDFIAKFADREPTPAYADRFLDFAQTLEEILNCPVDLITEESVRNPYFQQEIKETGKLVYERAIQESPV